MILQYIQGIIFIMTSWYLILLLRNIEKYEKASMESREKWVIVFYKMTTGAVHL